MIWDLKFTLLQFSSTSAYNAAVTIHINILVGPKLHFEELTWPFSQRNEFAQVRHK